MTRLQCTDLIKTRFLTYQVVSHKGPYPTTHAFTTHLKAFKHMSTRHLALTSVENGV